MPKSDKTVRQKVTVRVRLRPLRRWGRFRRKFHNAWQAFVVFLFTWYLWPLRPMKRERFEALVGFVRHPAAMFITPEVEWYHTCDERLLGVVNLDIQDDDFYVGVLGRDTDGRYRLLENEASISAPPAARRRLARMARRLWFTKKTVFPQGDERGRRQDLFAPRGDNKPLHPGYIILRDSRGHTPGRGLIAEMMHHYVDVDGNFIEQFQTTGFDSRVWELYLWAYFNEEALLIDRPVPAPDFVVSNGRHRAAVEAVTVNRSQGKELEDVDPEKLTPERIAELSRDYMPIKFGSSLFSKLSKHYWELPSVKGLPLVFAIADFHEKQSMLWTSTSLTRYLYGVSHDFTFDDHGKLIISPLTVEKHVHKDKEIPSGFFFQPSAEHISAVLFSASGTISKFNRLGKIAGFGDKDIIMIRVGNNHRHDPNAALPDRFVFDIDEDYSETWGEGISIFHNPNAAIPLPVELFPSVAHHRFENGQIVSQLPDFFPYSSMTMILVPTDGGSKDRAELEAVIAAQGLRPK